MNPATLARVHHARRLFSCAISGARGKRALREIAKGLVGSFAAVVQQRRHAKNFRKFRLNNNLP